MQFVLREKKSVIESVVCARKMMPEHLHRINIFQRVSPLISSPFFFYVLYEQRMHKWKMKIRFRAKRRGVYLRNAEELKIVVATELF